MLRMQTELRSERTRGGDETGSSKSPAELDRVSSWWGFLLGVWVICCPVGCKALITAIDPDDTLEQVWNGTPAVKPGGMSEETWTVLRYWDMEKEYLKDPDQTVQGAKKLFRDHPDREWACALAELCFWEGNRRETAHFSEKPVEKPDGDWEAELSRGKVSPEIEEYYLDSVSYAFYFLFADGKPINEFDRRVATACRYYNAGLERCLLLASLEDRFVPQQPLRLQTPAGLQTAEIDYRGFVWRSDEFNELHFANRLRGMQSAPPHPRRSLGLGVPLIGVRHRGNDGDERERFLVKRHPFAATAFYRPDLSRLTPYVPQETLMQVSASEPELLPPELRPNEGRLELYDPLRVKNLRINGMGVPLESDLSAPMMFAMGDSQQKKFEWTGFFDPESISQYSGLYMIEPFQKGKIPVICVHGMLSGPLTWTGMFEELWSDPTLRERYQFAFFLYPTGAPFLDSARRLREEIDEMQRLHGSDEATRHMVLVGHSMGGLLSKLQISSSDDKLWGLVSHRPLEELKTTPETREELQQAFFFEPQPAVERVVFIATPHLGSELSDAPLGRVGSWLVSAPQSARSIQRQLIRDNPEALTPLFTGGVPNSVDLLSYDNPVLQVMYELPIEKGVHLHSIIGTRNTNVIGQGRVARFLTAGAEKEGDGVVPLESARLKGVESEVFVPSSHDRVHRHPLAYHELSRILHEHLAGIDPPATVKPIETEEDSVVPIQRGRIEVPEELKALPTAGEVRLEESE